MPPKSAEPPAFVLRYQSAIRSAPVSAYAKLLAFVLSSYANANGRSVFPSQRTLARDAGVALSTVTTRLNELASSGWIMKAERARNGRGWKRTGYRLVIPAAAHDDEPRPDGAAETMDSTECEPDREGGDVYRATVQPARGVPSHGIGVYRHTVLTSPLTSPDPRHAHARTRGDGLAYPSIVQALVGQGIPQGQCLNDRGQRIIAGWVANGVTMPVLSQALARALRAKPGGNVPPAYLDPIITELMRQPSGASHEDGGRSRESGVDAFWRNAASSQ